MPRRSAHRPARILGPPSLAAFAHAADEYPSVRRSDVWPGDLIYVRTQSSLYTILACGCGSYEVSGGWFDRHGASPRRIAIVGCGLGGTYICLSSLAACGLSIEFGNRVRTSPVQRIVVLPRYSLQ